MLPRWLLTGAMGALATLEAVSPLDLPVNGARPRRVNGVFMFHDLSKARRELGYAPRPIDDAVLSMLKDQQLGKNIPFPLFVARDNLSRREKGDFVCDRS